MIDINILPAKAQNELIDFYQFLVERYVSRKRNKRASTFSSINQINTFYDDYNVDLKDFTFNRSELYDR